jgi:hypothetical protein
MVSNRSTRGLVVNRVRGTNRRWLHSHFIGGCRDRIDLQRCKRATYDLIREWCENDTDLIRTSSFTEKAVHLIGAVRSVLP